MTLAEHIYYAAWALAVGLTGLMVLLFAAWAFWGLLSQAFHGTEEE